ncbi:MAG: hypothetical protein VKJ04_09935 [Vampirovibrionales bacterium]|nr:hypothetical protein [Vampirovibrionales bacterium]
MADLTTALNDFCAGLNTQAQAHYDAQVMEPLEVQENLHIVREYLKIAVGLITQEGQIELPGTPMPVNYDEKTASQVLTLFFYGVLHALDKCVEFQLNTEQKTEIMKDTAVEIFSQAKQLTVLTFGQEATPNLQITTEQQRGFMQQSSENHLVHFLTQYEKIHGITQDIDSGFEDDSLPQQIQMQPAQPLPQAPSVVHNTPVEEAPALETPAPDPPPASDEWADDDFDDFDDPFFDEDVDWLEDLKRGDLSGKHQYKDKKHKNSPLYKCAAVALLLNTVNGALERRILANFDEKQRQSIRAYQDNPDKIFQELDLGLVNTYLRQFQSMIDAIEPSSYTKTQKQIRRLVQAYPRQSVLSSVERERPNVKRYVEGYYASLPEAGSQTGEDPAESSLGKTLQAFMGQAEASEVPVAFSGKIEEILYHHLNKTLSFR